MEKQIAFCLCTAVIISTSVYSTQAAEIVHQWNYSDADDGAVVATLTDDGVMSIQGSGWCDPPGTNNFWKGWNQLGYSDTIKEVVYGEGIMDTGPGAFGGCHNITRITLPSTLKEIERYAFNNTDIEEINIPDSVTTIGYMAFTSCDSLKSVNLPKSLSSLDSDVFASCDSLEEVTINCPNLRLIDDYTFNYCPELQSVKIAGGLKEIGYQAFARCVNLEGITLPEGLQEIGSLAFSECYKLTDIIIPKSVTEIHNKAFEYVPGPFGVYCGSYALDYCKERKLPYYIVDAEENRPEILDDLQCEYYKDVLADIQIPVNMRGATKLTQVRIGSSVVPADNYSVENGLITISSDYLYTLDADKYGISLTFNDCAKTTLSVKLYVYEKVSDREAPYLIQDTIKFDGSDVELKFDPGKGDLETTDVLSLVVDDTIILPEGSTLPLSRTNVRDIVAAYEASLELDEPFIEEIPEDVTVATPSEPVRPATPSEPIKPATPSEPLRPATPSEPIRPATTSEPDHITTPSEPVRVATPSEPVASKPRKLSRKEKRIRQLSTLLAAIDNGSDTVFWVNDNTITLSGEYISSMDLLDGNHLIGAIFDNTEKTTDLKKVVLIVGEPEEPEIPPVPEEPDSTPVLEESEESTTHENDSDDYDTYEDGDKLSDGSINPEHKPTVPSDGGYFNGSGDNCVYIKSDGSIAENEWVSFAGNWYYIGVNGIKQTGWFLDIPTGKWYMLGAENGDAQFGWYYEKQDGKWYFLNPFDGAMLVGWQFIDGKWYYFTEYNSAPTYSGNNRDGWWYAPTVEIRPYGSMYIGEITPDNYFVGDTGACIK